MESEVRKEETTSRDCLVQFLFVFLKKKNTFPFLMVIHACPFTFLMQSYHMTMLTIFKLWAVGSTSFPTYTHSKIDVLLDIETKTFYPLKTDT